MDEEIETESRVEFNLDKFLSKHKEIVISQKYFRSRIIKSYRNDFQDLRKTIADCEEGSVLNEILNHSRLSEEDVDRIKSHLQACLLEEITKLGDFQISIFGSFANGLALKGNC